MFLDPLEVLGHLPIRAHDRVGDFGAGEGRYSSALAPRVPDGAVYAFDALPLHIVGMGRQRGHAPNLYPLVADLNQHIPLKDGILTAGVVANTLHALREREQFLRELSRVMAHQAPVLVIDWMSSFNDMGPRPQAVLGIDQAVRLFTSEGFETGAMLPAGSHHYAFVATKV